MKTFTRLILVTTGALTMALSPLSVLAQGAEHIDWSISGLFDYNDCTDEVVEWVLDVQTVQLANETGSGQGVYMDHSLFEGSIYGQTTGFEWKSKGLFLVKEIYALDNSLTGVFVWVENAYARPITPDAPRMRLDVKVHSVFNANGELVVDSFEYVYHCLGN